MDNSAKKRRIEESGSPDQATDLTIFRDWLLKNGCDFLKQLEFKEIVFGEGKMRGTFTTMNIDVDATITRIPGSLMMPSERARRTDICSRLQARATDLGLKVSNHTYLAAWLMHQRSEHMQHDQALSALRTNNYSAINISEGQDQPVGGWGPYIRVLPKAYSDPLWWTPEVMR